MSWTESVSRACQACLATPVLACIPTLCAGANLYTVDLGLTPPGAANTIDLEISGTLLGQTQSDSDTGTVTGNMLVEIGATIDAATMEVLSVETLEFTGGRIAISNMSFALRWFLVGAIDIESNGMGATFDTPDPPGAVSGENFDVAEHLLVMNEGSFSAEGSGLIADFLPENPYVIDLSQAPIDATTDATGFIEVGAPEIQGGRAWYDVTLTLPVAIEEVILEEPDVASVTAIGSTTIEARGRFSQSLPDFGAVTPPVATALEETGAGATSFVRGAGDTELEWSMEVENVSVIAAVDGSFSDPGDPSNRNQFHINNADVVILTEPIDVRDQENLQLAVDLRTWDTSTGFEPEDYLELAIRVSDDGISFDRKIRWLYLSGTSLTSLNGGRDGPFRTYTTSSGFIPADAKSMRIALSVSNNSPNEHVIWDNLRVAFMSEGTEFSRADANADGQTDISDAISILGHLFLGDPANLPCDKAADVDDLGSMDLTDAVFLFGYLFLGGAEPPPPFSGCGLDETEDNLDCEEFPACGG